MVFIGEAGCQGNGYGTEMKTTGKQDGKPFTSIFRSQAKYLGPCPAK